MFCEYVKGATHPAEVVPVDVGEGAMSRVRDWVQVPAKRVESEQALRSWIQR